MGIPRRVREDAAQADDALRGLLTPPSPVPSEPTASDPPPADPTPPAPLADPAPPADPVPPVAAQPVDARAYAELQQQYRTLQGNHGRLLTEVEALKVEVGRLRTAPPPTTPTAAAPTPAPAPSTFTDSERKEWGDEFFDVVERIARGVFGTPLAALDGRLKRAEEALRVASSKADRAHEFAETSAEERFIATLTSRCPQWQQLDTDPGMLDWLEKMDMLAGKPRFQLLREAHAELNAERVAGFFNAYLRESGRGATPAPATPAVDPAAIVSPTPAAPRPPNPNPAPGRTWTVSEVDAFYRDKRRGKYTPQRAAELEADIDRALVEGRVRD